MKIVKQNKRLRYESMKLHPPDFWQRCKDIWCRKDSLFYKCCWENWVSTYRKLKLVLRHSSCTSINLKCIKNLNIGSETWKLVQESARNILELIAIGNDFLNGSATQRKD
jgi:hypothetical protein